MAKRKTLLNRKKPVPQNSALFIDSLKRNFNQFIDTRFERRFYIFGQETSFHIRSPLVVAQALLAFILPIVIVSVLAPTLFPLHFLNDSQIVKITGSQQKSMAVAGKDNIQRSIIVKRTDITKDSHYLKLPKNAKNISVKTISKKEATKILSSKTPKPKLAMEDRIQLASNISKQKKEPSIFLAALSKFFLANVKDAVEGVIEVVTEKKDDSVKKTSDSVVVDLKEHISKEEEKEEKKIEKEKEKEIKEEKKENNEETITDEQSSEEIQESEKQEEVIPEESSPSEKEEVIPSEDKTQKEAVSSKETSLAPEEREPEISESSNNVAVPALSEAKEKEGSKEEPKKEKIVKELTDGEYIEIDYETPAPLITEEETSRGKLITVSDPEENPDVPLKNVLAYTSIPEIFKVGEEGKIKLKWKTENNKSVQFDAYDTDDNGRLDYVEWTVPHLSEQVFELIFISKAFELDSNQEIIEDIYDLVKDQDNIWATIEQNNYVRFAFEKEVNNRNDITLYAKATNSGETAKVNVYPLYEDGEGNLYQGELIATFDAINEKKAYKIILSNLVIPTKEFDLQIVDADIDIDLIIDPSAYLVNWWKFDETAENSCSGGEDACDSIGGDHGEVAGNEDVTITTEKAPLNFTNLRARQFGGSNDYIEVSSPTIPFANNARTITAWINWDGGNNNYGNILSYGQGDCTGKQFGLGTGGAIPGKLTFWGGCRDFTSSLDVPTGTWTFIAAVYSSGTITLYMNYDGTTESGSTTLAGALNTQSSNLFIGVMTEDNGDTITDSFDGKIDDVRVYSKALSSTEITALAEGYEEINESTPAFTSGPSDGSSSSTTPTNAGSNITFTATATDSVDEDDYYLAICKTDAVTAVNSSAPTCDGGSWAISSSTASGAQASVTYTTITGDSESNVWYAFVCDNNDYSLCSSSSQGSGNSGSPFAVNHVPSFSAISNTSGYIKSGNSVTFTSTSSDSDTNGSADTVTLYVCKANDFTGSACGAGGTWCTSSASASNASCSYEVQAGDGDNTYSYYGFIVDNHSLASSSNPRSSTFNTDTTAPTTSDDFTNDDTWVNSNQTITLTPNCNTSGCGYTKYCTDSTNTCTVSSGTSYTSGVSVSTEGVSYFRYASEDNAGNTQTTVSLTVKIDIDDPSTTADAGVYTFGNWSNVNVSTTLSCDDSDSGCASIKYCTDSSNTCTPATTYSSAITISGEGTTYIRYFSTDNAGNEETVFSKTVKIDTTNPSINAGTDKTKNAQFTQDATVSDSASGVATYQWSKVSGSGDITFGSATAEDTTVEADADDTYVIRLTVVDNAGNSDYNEFVLTWDTTAPVLAESSAIGSTTDTTPSYSFTSNEAGTITYGGSCSSATTSATSGANTITLTALALGTYSNCTITVTDSEGNASTALSISSFTIASADTGGPSGGYSSNLFGNIIQFFFPPTPTPQTTKEEVAPTIPQDTPPAFEKDNLVIGPTKITGSPIPLNANFFAQRVSHFNDTLNKVGIDANKVEDVKRLSGLNLYIPGLTASAFSNYGEYDAQKLSQQKAVPLARLNSDVKQNIPSNIVFARSPGELIDYSIALIFDDKGNAQQSINTIVGEKIELVIKPEHTAIKVEGLLLVKKVGDNNSGNIVLNALDNFVAALTGSLSTNIEPDNKLLVQKFEYNRIEGGLFKAEIEAPTVNGEYDVITMIEYADPEFEIESTTLTLVVDPEGYVYRQLSGYEARIKNAEVSIYWLNPESEEYELWPAEKFLQKNPQKTDETGNYSFLVPPGKYYLTVTAYGHSDYQSDEFEVKENNGVHIDIELKKKDWFTWLIELLKYLFSWWPFK